MEELDASIIGICAKPLFALPPAGFTHLGKSLTLTPVVVDFHRLYKAGTLYDETSVDGLSFKLVPAELMHAVVGLFDLNLPDMETSIIYDGVFDKWGKTIVLLREPADALTSLREREGSRRGAEVKEEKPELTEPKTEATDDDVPNIFRDLYSDSSAGEEEDEDEEDEEAGEADPTKEQIKFVADVRERRRVWRAAESLSEVTTWGIENLVTSAASFKRVYLENSDRVIHLLFIAVRKLFQRAKLGQWLLRRSREPTITGSHDVVLVHADPSATEFFRKHAFVEDALLNSRYSELATLYTNCKMMVFIPSYAETGDLDQMLADLQRLEQSSLYTYRHQRMMVMRMAAEVTYLRGVASKQSILLSQCEKDTDYWREKCRILKQTLSALTDPDQDFGPDSDKESESDIGGGDVSAPVRTRDIVNLGLEFTDIVNLFKKSAPAFCITAIYKAVLPSAVLNEFEVTISEAGVPPIILYLAQASDLQQLKTIAYEGFRLDSGDSVLGQSPLRFTEEAASAIRLTHSNHLLVCNVVLLTQQDKWEEVDGVQVLNLADVRRAIPLDLIKFTAPR